MFVNGQFNDINVGHEYELILISIKEFILKYDYIYLYQTMDLLPDA